MEYRETLRKSFRKKKNNDDEICNGRFSEILIMPLVICLYFNLPFGKLLIKHIEITTSDIEHTTFLNATIF